MKKHKAAGYDIEKLYEKVTIQLNDTHPVISIPELIRILVDNEGLSFEKALEIAKKTFNYTNHTVMAEAMEKWGLDIVKEVLPEIYDIILQINEAFVAEMYAKDMPKGKTDYMKMISGGVVHMAKMAVYCSSYTNGVAALHTEILKNDVLKDWYQLFPEKFQNKTNGITPRRWIALCNKELSSLITEQLGDNSWVTDLSRLKTLERLRGDNNMMQRFMDIKQEKKNQLAAYMKAKDGIEVDVNKLIKVVFIQNYNVSYAEKLVTAADISEQISTAGTEASGTGNMKFMLNGTVTLGTYDGANVEIVQEAGESNNYIFGARVEELEKIMKDYDPRKLVSKNPKIKRVLDTLIDGTVSDGGTGDFKELYFALTDGASWHVPDHYYLLGDLESYVEAKLKANSDYAKKCWANMCFSGKFSSDRTISDYAKEIWKIEPVQL